jgi:hypothetical protein
MRALRSFSVAALVISGFLFPVVSSWAQPLQKGPALPAKGAPTIAPPKGAPTGPIVAKPTGVDPIPPPHVAKQACQNGVCTLVECERGFLDENRRFDDGCEKGTPLQIPASRLKVWLTAADENFETRPQVQNLCATENQNCITKWKNLADPLNNAEQWGHSYFPNRTEFCPRFGVVRQQTSTGGGGSTLSAFTPIRRATYLELGSAFLPKHRYAIYARVQPMAEKNTSYFVGTDAQGCGVFTCQRDTGLHLGWRSPAELTLDQFDHGVNLAASGGFIRNGNSTSSPMRVVRAKNDGQRLEVAVSASGAPVISAQSTNTPALIGATGQKLYIGRGFKSDQGFEGSICDVAVIVDPEPDDERILNQFYGLAP